MRTDDPRPIADASPGNWSTSKSSSTNGRRAAFIFLVRDDEVLFVKHTASSNNPSDTYSIPGGRIEPGEEPRTTAVREVFEETGLTVREPSLVELGTRSEEIETRRGMETWEGTLYLCREFHGVTRTMEEAEEPVWVKIDHVLEGRYRMPRMSSNYQLFIMTTLSDQLKRATLSQ